MILYAATANRGKLAEFAEHAGPGIEIRPIPNLEPVEETGATFEENARLKAAHYSSAVSGLVFADDSGIEVAALGGAPGVFSARYAGPECDDRANNAKLLAEIANHKNRQARFVCVIALAESGNVVATFDGVAEGVVIDSPRGAGGFGYDPLFYFPTLGCTFAELPPDQKWIHSHRGAAFSKMREYLLRP